MKARDKKGKTALDHLEDNDKLDASSNDYQQMKDALSKHASK